LESRILTASCSSSLPVGQSTANSTWRIQAAACAAAHTRLAQRITELAAGFKSEVGTELIPVLITICALAPPEDPNSVDLLTSRKD
jgi:hypothetical protein